jgi:hypothetical protein
MKHLFFMALILSVWLLGCQKKSVPVITERKSEPPKIARLYPPEGSVLPDTLMGKTVFINRCSRCHGLPDLQKYTRERWEDILESMIPGAGINQENAVHIRAYVLASILQ